MSTRAAGSWSLVDFYDRRFRRLFPALAFTIAVTLALGFLLLGPTDLGRLGRAAVYSLVFFPNVLSWMEAGYFDVASKLKPLLHLWSLGVEEQFYLLWPVVLGWLLPFGRSRVLLAVGLLVLVSAVAGDLWVEVDASAAFYLLPFRCFELGLGAFLGLVVPGRELPRFVAEGLGLVGVVAILLAVAGFDESTRFPGFAALIPAGGAALVIHAGMGAVSGRILSNRVLVGIGLISYSLYLIHWPILVYWHHWTLQPLTTSDQFVIAGLSLGAAVLMYRWVEQPFRVQGEGGAGSARFVASCFAVSAVLLIPSLSAWQYRGLPLGDSGHGGQFASPLDARVVECRGRDQGPGCLIGDLSIEEEAFLLIGDSHAGALAPGFDEVARELGVKGRWWGVPGCPPVFGVAVHGTVVGLERCRAGNAEWRQFVAEKKPKLVILAGRWSLYTEKSDASSLFAGGERFFVGPNTARRSRENSRGVFESWLPRTVRSIRESGARVMVIGQVPEPGMDPARCAGAPLLGIGQANREARCRMAPYGQINARLKFSNRVIAGLRRPGVVGILPEEIFCDSDLERCVVERDGRVLYRDSNHLGVEGSRFLVRSFRPQFEGLLAGER